MSMLTYINYYYLMDFLEISCRYSSSQNAKSLVTLHLQQVILLISQQHSHQPQV